MLVRGTDAEVTPLSPGLSRQILGHDAQLMMVRVIFTKGAVGALHSHPHRQVSLIERGRFQLTIGAETREVAAGDSFFVEPGLTHGAVALEDGVIIDVFSPAREDFL
jgi:quercetin dioxygenase-like cupin family protein